MVSVWDNVQRYARHLILPEIGQLGQRKIRQARVLCVGAGGLGSPVLLYLAAAGVGRLGIVDHDRVDVSNLQRQVLHTTPDAGRLKTESAAARLRALNPDVEVVEHPVRLSRVNVVEILTAYDIVVDGSDNFPTRYLINDACVLLNKPNVYGAIYRFEGQASLFAPHMGGPCYRCLYPEPPPRGTVPSCTEAGVLGVLPGVIGCIQATEVLKWIVGMGTSLLGRLLLYDALSMKFREIQVRRDPDCPICGEQPRIQTLQEYEANCPNLEMEGVASLSGDEVTVHELRTALAHPESGVGVIDVRERHEYAVAHLPGVRLLPLSELPQRWTELNPNQRLYLYCRAGGRSLQAVQFLKQLGFQSVKSVHGGLQAWVREIDPTFPLV
ncbi:MAG: molybdopterin-synthase adenylyltransferase MoeB [Verrucomicrobiota bacterium]|nr:molybdopterin-synthase adenylyltransferase MoeB [Verrucomicrobiota bacterium]